VKVDSDNDKTYKIESNVARHLDAAVRGADVARRFTASGLDKLWELQSRAHAARSARIVTRHQLRAGLVWLRLRETPSLRSKLMQLQRNTRCGPRRNSTSSSRASAAGSETRVCATAAYRLGQAIKTQKHRGELQQELAEAMWLVGAAEDELRSLMEAVSAWVSLLTENMGSDSLLPLNAPDANNETPLMKAGEDLTRQLANATGKVRRSRLRSAEAAARSDHFHDETEKELRYLEGVDPEVLLAEIAAEDAEGSAEGNDADAYKDAGGDSLQ